MYVNEGHSSNNWSGNELVGKTHSGENRCFVLGIIVFGFTEEDEYPSSDAGSNWDDDNNPSNECFIAIFVALCLGDREEYDSSDEFIEEAVDSEDESATWPAESDDFTD